MTTHWPADPTAGPHPGADPDTCHACKPRVHNHPPYRPTCNERDVDGQLRGACLNDDGSDRPDLLDPTQETTT